MEKQFDLFEVIESKDTLHIRFSSYLEYIDEACNTVTKFLTSTQEGLAPHMFAINLVMREGLINAIRHGNRNDPGKIVDIQLKIDRPKTILLEILDQGEGFDWKAQQTAELPGEEDHGRGIHIIGTYVTRYSYNPKGNLLYLEKTIA